MDRLIRQRPAFHQRARAQAGHAQLFCLPFAGGTSNSYNAWVPVLDGRLDVYVAQLPGRAERFAEPLPTDLPTLVRDLATEMVTLLSDRFAVFGHSMGAVVAFELARELSHVYGRSPACLVTSGHLAPEKQDIPRWHTLPDGALTSALKALGGTESGVLGEPELWELLLPTVRADLALVETHHAGLRPGLTCPLVAYGSTDDPVISGGDLDHWALVTSGPFESRRMPGGHFFFQVAPNEFAANLLDAVSCYLQ